MATQVAKLHIIMKTYTVQEAKEMIGMPIPRMELVVGRCYERKTGEGQYGPWSLQNATASDHTGDIKILFKNQPDQSHLNGKKIVFRSSESKKGLTGLSIQKKEYQGKESIELHVTASALILGVGMEEVIQQEGEKYIKESAERKKVMEMSQGSPRAHRETMGATQTPSSGLEASKARITQLGALYDLCFTQVGRMIVSLELGKDDVDSKKDIASCLFIQSVREGLANSMPAPKNENKPVKIVGAFPSHGGEPPEDDGYQANPDNVPF